MQHASLTLAIALAAGVLAQSVSRQVRLPGIILLLLTGAVLGPEGMAWIDPGVLGSGLFAVVDFGVAIILFEGGLNLEWSRLRRQEAAIRHLITTGALVTLFGGTLLAVVILGWRWDVALLFGSLVVVTGPTVVVPLLRDMRLQPRLRTILEAEGVFIDPVGALMAVALLQLVVTPEVQTLTDGAQLVAASLGFGVLAGVIAGLMMVAALRFRILIAQGYEEIATLAVVVLLFEACGTVVPESGLMAVTVAGVVVGNFKNPVAEELREFKDRLTVMFVGLLFVLLVADVSLNDVFALGTSGLAVVAGLMFVVRPLGVWIATHGLKLRTGERAFIAAIAPRGIVAAAVATITAATLENHGLERGQELKALVFLVIGVTVIFSGLAARPLAWLWSVRLPTRNRVAILGARGLALPLADRLKAADVPVVFLESDPKRSRIAEEAGYPVVFGDPLEERTLQRARPELVGTAIATTFNEHFNSAFVRLALASFGVPRGLVAMESLFGETTPRLLPAKTADVLFEGPHDYERWDARWRHGQVAIETYEYRQGSTSAEQQNERARAEAAWRRGLFAILTIQRGRRTMPMHVGFDLRTGDKATVAIYAPEHDAAVQRLAETGWRPASGEEEPGVSS